MTGLDRICCGCLCIIGFFFYEVAVLVYMQSIFYSSGHCENDTPHQYWWLLFNIIVYFVFLGVTVFFHLRSVCASVSKDEVEKELKEEEQAEASTKGNTMQ
jgi:heme/copper-type cytochrome/quinol oxidase subunit 2